MRRLVGIALTFSMPVFAGVKLSAVGAYVPSVRSITASSQSDYYDGFGYGGMLSLERGQNEFMLNFVMSQQTANYEDISPGPAVSSDQFLSIGARRYLANSHRSFIQVSVLGLFSDNFKSPSVGGTFGGGLAWKLASKINIGVTTVYGFVPYSGMHRRFLMQEIELGLSF
jgi:hypothetical protein